MRQDPPLIGLAVFLFFGLVFSVRAETEESTPWEHKRGVHKSFPFPTSSTLHAAVMLVRGLGRPGMGCRVGRSPSNVCSRLDQTDGEYISDATTPGGQTVEEPEIRAVPLQGEVFGRPIRLQAIHD